jgi:pimeloyl-ACP methyl ester carboxylesterase
MPINIDWKAVFEEKRVVSSDGVVLNYYDSGRGPKTLVVLNAYGQSFGYWATFLAAVSTRFRVILWLPRGNDGDTIGLRVASSQMVHARDLEHVLNHEGIKSCILLAWCTGPKLALEYYSRHPDRISSMLFVAGSFKGLSQHKHLETEYEKHLDPLLETIEKYPETADVACEYLKGILLAQGKHAPSIGTADISGDAANVNLQELVLQPFHAANVVAYAKQMREFWTHDFAAALNKVAIPVLFVGGDCDHIASQAIAKLVAGVIPDAKYLEVKGGTHYIHYEQWDFLVQVAEQVVNSGGAFEFHAPGTELTEFNQELMTARQG